jgi:hypothetical protein
VENTYTIYRFIEPLASVDTIHSFETIKYQYPDGSHDAEAILVDPVTKDIYIITKWDSNAKIYKVPYPQSLTTTNVAIFVSTLPFGGVVSAAISADKKEILVRTYSTFYYFLSGTPETLDVVFKKEPKIVGQSTEPQGEAISFLNDGSGFVTLSEKINASIVFLNFYPRK